MIRRLCAFGGLTLVGALLMLSLPVMLSLPAMAQDVDPGLGAAVLSLLGPYAPIAIGVVAVAKAICAVTPTPAPGSPWATVYRGVEWAALIFGKMKHAIVLVLVPIGLLALSACSGDSGDSAAVVARMEAAAPEVFKHACAAVSVADGSFKAVAPSLLASGALEQEDIDKEAAIFASVQVTCASPPTNLAAAAPALLGQASAIYLLIAGKG